jgi:hypothetical protein
MNSYKAPRSVSRRLSLILSGNSQENFFQTNKKDNKILEKKKRKKDTNNY